MKIKILLIALAVAVALASFMNVYLVRIDCGGGGLLWKGDTAYMFMGDCKAGVKMSLIRYLMEPIMEYFHAPAVPEHSKFVLTAFRVSPAGVERYVSQTDLSDLSTIGSEIYARCPGGVCKWTGDRFVLIAAEEEKRLFGNSTLSRGEFTNVNGWSKRGIQSSALYQETIHYELPVELNEELSLSVRGSNPVSVDVLRRGRPPERIWYHEQGFRRVKKTEYEQVFAQ
jgi:hypothetical protein